MVIILATTAAINVDPSDVFPDAIIAVDAILKALYGVWLIWGIFPRGNSVQGEAHETPVPAIGREPGATSYYRESGKKKSFMLTTNLIFGWVQTQAFFDAFYLIRLKFAENRQTDLAFYALLFLAQIGVGICAASSNEKGIAFWTVATWLLIDFEEYFFLGGFCKSIQERGIKL